jgi:hypothetical protein
MERLQHLNTLKELLWSDITNHVRPITKSFIQCRSAIVDMPAACLFGKCTLVTRTVARKHIAHLFNREDEKVLHNGLQASIELPASKACIPYLSHKDYIELDVEHIMQSPDKTCLPDVLKHLTSQKNISGARHVIVMHNVDSMSVNIMHAMRKVLETYAQNAYIIMTCRSMSNITDAIKSRCISINCVVRNIECLTSELIRKCRPELVAYSDKILSNADNDLINVITLLELQSPDTFKGHLTHFIETRLLEVCASESQELLEIKLREFCTRITAACVPLPVVAQKIIDFTTIHVREKLHEVINMATEMEHRTMISNKMLFALELFLHELVKLLRPYIQNKEASL